MTSFYHFTHRLVRRFSHFCKVSMQGPGGTEELPAVWGFPDSGAIRRIAHALKPINVSITSIRTTDYGAELHGFCRRGRSFRYRGRIVPQEVPIHIYLRRYDA